MDSNFSQNLNNANLFNVSSVNVFILKIKLSLGTRKMLKDQ